MVLVGIDVDFIELGPTPLRMLFSVVCLVVAAVGTMLVMTPLVSRWIDRRWPPAQPLSPTELLWGEMGKYVRRTFAGLEHTVAYDLVTQLEEVKVAAGNLIFEQDDPPTHYYWLKDGEAEVTQRIAGSASGAAEDRVVRVLGPGDAFGEVAILGRTARTATIRAKTDCTVLRLPADEFISALALSANDESAQFQTVERYLTEDRQRSANAQ